MRVLAVSDIHANGVALGAVAAAADADAVLCLGDLVDYGPEPGACVDWVRSHAAAAVRGNHDDALVRGVRCACAPDVQPLSDATQELARRLLSAEQKEWIAALPLQASVTLGGVRFHLVHATPLDPLFTYLPAEAVDAWERAVAGIDADVILVGHTHVPMILPVGEKLVVNPGSVGQPRAGDPYASFAVFDGTFPTLERVPYDVEATVRALGGTGTAGDVVAGLAALLRTGRTPG